MEIELRNRGHEPSSQRHTLVGAAKGRFTREISCVSPSRAVGTHVRIGGCASQKLYVDQRRKQGLRDDRVKPPQPLHLRLRESQTRYLEILGAYENEPLLDVRLRPRHVEPRRCVGCCTEYRIGCLVRGNRSIGRRRAPGPELRTRRRAQVVGYDDAAPISPWVR